MRALALGALLLVAAGCGGGASGPSPVPTPAPAAAVVAAAPAPRALPANVSPEYVRALVAFDGAGFPRMWEGGFSHCGAVDVALAAELSELSGQAQRAGACNVEWVRVSGVGHSYAEIHGGDRVLVFAKLFLYDDTTRTARHELGHVLGLRHSPRRDDLMAESQTDAATFSGDERRVLAWLYGR